MKPALLGRRARLVRRLQAGSLAWRRVVCLGLAALAWVGAGAERVSFCVLTWNIHHGEGLDGRVDLARMARLIRESRVDLVALQEVDRGVARTDRIDMPAELARLTGMTALFENNFAFQGGEYGNAILSRWPVVTHTNRHYRMVRPGEQRGCLQAVLRLPSGRRLEFWSTHLDYRRDPAERLANVAQLHEWLEAGPPRPVILAGDFNDFPHGEVWRRLDADWLDAWMAVGRGEGWTFSSDRPRSRIDYVWIRRLEGAPRPIRAEVLESKASDHRPLKVEMAWPE